MTTSFARTTHALQAADLRKAGTALVLVSLLIMGWLGWFLLARITIFAISTPVPVAVTEMITAPFIGQAPGQIKWGQTASLKLDGATGETTGPIPALVTEVVEDTERGVTQVTAFVFWDAVAEPPAGASLTGRLEIETEYVSPATLLVRSVNDGMDTYPVRFTDPSGQTNQRNP
ncbi:MAG: hypothetical protein R3C14_47110 [Caldilineaceae bacterium]